jgi:hypothetical protein
VPTKPYHRSCSRNRNSPSYSYRFQEWIDREGWSGTPRRPDRSHALVVPTKSTRTGSTTFPILTMELSFLLCLSSRLCRQRRSEPSSSLPQPKSHFCSAYQVDEDRVGHLSCSPDRNSTSYSYYFEDYVDREGGESPLCRRDRYRALVVPTKSTLTATTTFPVARTETLLPTPSILRVVSTEKVVSVRLVVGTDEALL